jgi:hypothetical protein
MERVCVNMNDFLPVWVRCVSIACWRRIRVDNGLSKAWIFHLLRSDVVN